MGFEYSEVSRRQKKFFYLFLLVFIMGFVLLGLIGDSINADGFVFLGFLAPLAVLVGIIGITWSLYRGDKSDKDDRSDKGNPSGKK